MFQVYFSVVTQSDMPMYKFSYTSLQITLVSLYMTLKVTYLKKMQ
jgi:hypothetical protein